MLYLWTGASTDNIKKVIGPIVAKYKVPHQVWSDTEQYPPATHGDTVLAFGAKTLSVLQAMGAYPKNRKVTSLREKPIVINGASVLVTYDPAAPLSDYAKLPEIQWDINLAIRVHNTGSTKPKIGDYRYVDSLHELIARIQEKYAETGKPVKVAPDLETLGLDEYNPHAWIIAISFTVDKGKSDVVYFEKHQCPTEPMQGKLYDDLYYYELLWIQINWILNSRMVSVRGANFKYDCRWMRKKWNITCTNFKFDTVLVGSLLDENRSNSLKLLVKIMTEMGGYEDDMKTKYDMARLDLVPMPEMLPYVGGDTDGTYQVSDTLQVELFKDKRLADFYINLMHPASLAFEKMERVGVLVDVPYYKNLEAELDIELHRLGKLMAECLPYKLQHKYMDSIAEALEDGSSPLKPKLLKEFLFSKEGLNLKPLMFTEKKNEPSTAVDHLLMFKDSPEAQHFVKLFEEFGSAAKTRSTYVVGFLKHLRVDNRFHPHYMLFRGAYGEKEDASGAVTGRTSAKDPAVQTVPKHTKWTKKLRRAFIAPPGKMILQLDYSQGELRITAVAAEEPTMLQAYINNMDLHAITAAEINDYTLEEFMALPEELRDELRSGGKAGNFGLIYGMQPPGFVDYAYSTYGVTMSLEQAQIAREKFFNKYDRLLPWHGESIAFAREHKHVRSFLGRIRHLPLINSKMQDVRSQAERQSINSPIQSCLSDMMQLAMVRIGQEYPGNEVQLFMMTHDSIAAYIPDGEQMIWAPRLKEIMENLPLKQLFGFDSPLKFIVDAEYSVKDNDGVYSLAALKKMKGL